MIIEILVNNHSGKSLLFGLNKQEKIQLYKKGIDPSKLLFDIQAAAILQLYKDGIQRSQINLNRFSLILIQNYFILSEETIHS